MTKVCDKCREESKFHVEQSDGTILCYDCVKKERGVARRKSSVGVRTNDKFVKMCRRMREYTSAFPFAGIYVRKDEGLCYTNGHVMLSDFDSTDMVVDATRLSTLKKERSAYPDVSRALKRTTDGVVVEVPEDFYEYLKAFTTHKRGYARVEFHGGGIRVVERDPLDVSMNYELDYSALESEVHVDAVYMHELRPRELRLCGYDRAAVVESSYVDYVDQRKHVIIMPMQPTEKMEEVDDEA